MKDEFEMLLALVAKAIGKTPEEARAKFEAKRDAYRRRVYRNNAAYDALVRSMDVLQVAKVTEAEARGYRTTKMLSKGGRVAALLQNDAVWNPNKGKIGRKLMIVYANGRTSETFERTISIDWK